MPSRHTREVAEVGELSKPCHISKTVPSTIHLGPPEEARTLYKDRGVKDYRAPSHISKMVLSTVHFGPPRFTVDTTIFEMWLGSLSKHTGLAIPVL